MAVPPFLYQIWPQLFSSKQFFKSYKNKELINIQIYISEW